MKNYTIFNEVVKDEYSTTISGSFIINGESLPFAVTKANGRISYTQFDDKGKGKGEENISIEYMVWNFNSLVQLLGKIVPKTK